MYKEISYSKYNTYEKWLELYNTNHVYWYDPSLGYCEVRTVEILRDLYDDEDYCDGVYIEQLV